MSEPLLFIVMALVACGIYGIAKKLSSSFACGWFFGVVTAAVCQFIERSAA